MTKLSETRHAGAFVVSELDGWASRVQGTIAENMTLLAGQVLGRTGAAAQGDGTIIVNAAVKGSPFTGAGSLDLAGTGVANYDVATVQEGIYTVKCKTKNTGGGVFTVTDPNGVALADATEGAAYSTQIKFTINASGADFEVGDTFTVAVDIPEVDQTGEWCILDVDGSGGAQIAQGVLFDDVTTAGATGTAVIVSRMAVVRASDIILPAGATDAQKATAYGHLYDRGIIVRE